MKSVCIKTNNTNYIKYLLNELKYLDVNNVCISQKEFKNYKNIIIHYLGSDNNYFLHNLSTILSCFVIDELEENFLKRIMQKNYFYFNASEKKEILNLCFDVLSDDFDKGFDKKYNILINDFFNYLLENKSIILDGFVNFRIKDYFLILEESIDEAVNSFIIEKEYYEFVSLLKVYINSQNTKLNLIHLIYKNGNSILLDENKSIIDTNNILNSKYLSDISFSSNDFALNYLLSNVPKKIYIHLIDNNVDEFINTIKLIFEKKAEFCTDCNICNIYRNASKIKSK